MKKKNFKNLIILFAILVITPIFVLTLNLSIAQAGPELGMDYIEPLKLANGDPRDAAVSLVGLLMTFLGIIAVVIMLYGGFIWMTAAGNEENVNKAKKIIAAGVIGLVIILAAYVIVNFVVENVSNALEEA